MLTSVCLVVSDKKSTFAPSLVRVQKYMSSVQKYMRKEVLVTYKRVLRLVVVVGLLSVALVSCRHAPVPKPYGYYRIAIPDTLYTDYSMTGCPYSFALSGNAKVQPHYHEGEQYWIDIVYPTLNTTIHCSYKPVRNNLRILSRDAQEFLYSHVTVASAIPEQEFSNAESHVWGVYYELHGNTASPIQFYLTDSIEHFFRGSVYCNTIPNQDSLAPIYDYMRTDVRRLIESFRWEDKK